MLIHILICVYVVDVVVYVSLLYSIDRVRVVKLECFVGLMFSHSMLLVRLANTEIKHQPPADAPPPNLWN